MKNCNYFLQPYINTESYLLLLVVLFVLFILVVILKLGVTKLNIVGITLIVSGGVGNISQRVSTGCVWDNLRLGAINFNFYDILIVTGIFVIIFGNYEYFINRR